SSILEITARPTTHVCHVSLLGSDLFYHVQYSGDIPKWLQDFCIACFNEISVHLPSWRVSSWRIASVRIRIPEPLPFGTLPYHFTIFIDPMCIQRNCESFRSHQDSNVLEVCRRTM